VLGRAGNSGVIRSGDELSTLQLVTSNALGRCSAVGVLSGGLEREIDKSWHRDGLGRTLCLESRVDAFLQD
jgi:hypothetical protein